MYNEFPSLPVDTYSEFPSLPVDTYNEFPSLNVDTYNESPSLPIDWQYHYSLCNYPPQHLLNSQFTLLLLVFQYETIS